MMSLKLSEAGSQLKLVVVMAGIRQTRLMGDVKSDTGKSGCELLLFM